MDVFINGRFLTQSITGVQRYAIELLSALDEYYTINGLPKNIKITILVPRISNIKYGSFANFSIKQVGKLQGHLWEQFELYKFTKGELLVNLCNTGPIIKKNQITVIHDAAVFSNSSNFSLLFRVWYKIMLKMLGKFSKKIVTVSQFSKKELLNYLNISETKVNVIYEGKEHFIRKDSDKSIIERYNLIDKPYLLAVSSLNPNKNFKSIIRALDFLDDEVNFKVVIAGGTDPKVFSKKGTELPSFVDHVGYVTDEELKALYENAFCFIYPSFYEGFGLPPLEAMSTGCPVIISNVASLPEVGGDAALYCNPYNPEDIANRIKELMSDNTFRNQLIEQGYMQAESFSWKKCAVEFQSVISDSLIKEG
ncbi:glycosyltransferase family 4 protein [Niallia circulans]|uniref:glycosyltransferase family 4 protein n=1 Tax=Niallia circulans TaxID=1397 RepID=UPI001F164F17|nr:glycosyltransferase family 1 protein [Niallia circulans]MCF2649127.1 glycosyltransferase family 4 protein [Niallia circulans]